jgi:uncharacterized protein DUF5676
MLNVKTLTLSLAVTAAITFVLCVVYGLIVPPAYHAGELLEKFLPGFHWITPLGFLVGLVESFIFGAYHGLLIGLVYNFFQRRWEPAH